ncbi:MAG: hypothetical protein WDA16_13800 [Candidatus Thermoplasmatota archaeon]
MNRRIPTWALVATLVGILLALALSFAGDARAQGFDRLDAHTPPDIPGQGTPDGGFLSWLDENKWWLLFATILGAVLLIASWLLNQDARHKKLQRDGLEKLRMGLVASCKATRGPAKSVWLTGSPRDPPSRVGRYRGHHRSVEAVWIAYATWLFGKTQLVAVNPVDLNGLDAPEIHVRAIAINQTRGFGFAVPDTHNATQRAEWAHSSPAPLATPVESAEAWKAYYARAVDNALAFYDAMNAAEDRSFLRQEVTRTPDELTETILAPAPQPAPEVKHDD